MVGLAYVASHLPYHQYYGDAIPAMISDWEMWLRVLPAASVGLPLPAGLAGLALSLLLTRRRGSLPAEGDGAGGPGT